MIRNIQKTLSIDKVIYIYIYIYTYINIYIYIHKYNKQHILSNTLKLTHILTLNIPHKSAQSRTLAYIVRRTI